MQSCPAVCTRLQSSPHSFVVLDPIFQTIRKLLVNFALMKPNRLGASLVTFGSENGKKMAKLPMVYEEVKM